MVAWTIAVLFVLFCGALWWLGATQSGLTVSARAIAWASGGRVALSNPRGTLAGRFEADSLRLSTARMQLAAHSLTVDWSPAALLRGVLDVRLIRAADVTLAKAPSSEPSKLPLTLRLPLAVAIRNFDVGRLAISELPQTAAPIELRDVHLQVGADGRIYRITQLRFATRWGTFDAHGTLGAGAPYALDAKVTATGNYEEIPYHATLHAGGTLQAVALVLQAEAKQAALHAAINVAPFDANLLKQAKITLDGVDPAAFVAGAPHAVVHLSTDLEAHGATLAGPIELANTEPGALDRHRLPLRTLRGQLGWNGARATLADIDAAFAGGTAQGNATLERGRMALDLAVHDVDLAAALTTLKPTLLTGTVRATANGGTQQIAADLRDARFTVALNAQKQGDAVTVTRAQIAAGSSKLDASATLNLAGNRSFAMHAMLDHFDPAAFAKVPAGNINADLSANGSLGGGIAANARFTLRKSSIGGQPLAGHGELAATSDRLERSDIALDLGGNRVTAKGAFGKPGDKLAVAVDARHLDAVGRALGMSLGGTVHGRASVAGTLTQPSATFDLSAANIAMKTTQVAQATLRGSVGAGANGRVDVTATLAGYRRDPADAPLVATATLKISGTRGAHRLDLHAGLGGGHTLTLAARGGLAQGLAWKGKLEQLMLTDARRQTLIALAAPASLAVSASRIVLGAADLQGTRGRAHLAATEWTPRSIVARGSVAGLRIARARGTDAMPIASTLTLGGSWNVTIGKTVDGSVELHREGGDVTLNGDQPQALGLQTLKIDVTAVQDRVNMVLDVRGSGLGTVAGRANVRLAHGAQGGWQLARNAPLSGYVDARVPTLQWLGPYLNPGLQTAGELTADVTLGGTAAVPRATGKIDGTKLAIALPDQGVALVDGVLHAAFDQDRLTLNELVFQTRPNLPPSRNPKLKVAELTATPGRVSASGTLTLADRRGAFTIDAVHLALLARPDRWLLASGAMRLTVAPDELAVTGKLTADAGRIEVPRQPPPALSDDVVVMGRAPAAQRRTRFKFDVVVDLGRRLYFTGRGLDTRLAGELHLVSNGSGPLRATGSIRAVDGTYDAYGHKLTIKRGIVNFQGPVDNPGLNVVAVRGNLPVEAGVEITGTVAKPHVRLISDPNVPDDEKLSWIVTGRSLEGGGANSALLLSAASAIFGGQEGGIPQRLAHSLGFDEFSISQGTLSDTTRLPTSTVAGSLSPDNNSTVTSQIVTLGKRLSDRLYLSYEQSTATAQNVVKFTYELTRRLSLVSRAGTDNAVDLYYTFGFD
ncbi:MAG TPA: translocation/assembly module TamB domain-containing protein [Burkholderiales bacterium]|nr:translocation/assembly module TamB domain-containing protein [Burkholderiales bacterium]